MEEKILKVLIQILETLSEMEKTMDRLARAYDRLNDTIHDELLGEAEELPDVRY